MAGRDPIPGSSSAMHLHVRHTRFWGITPEQRHRAGHFERVNQQQRAGQWERVGQTKRARAGEQQQAPIEMH